MIRRLALLAALLSVPAFAQPDPVAASPGLVLRLALGADGVQIYRCAQEAAGARWLFQAPEALLFDGQNMQQGTHGAGPFWRLADGSLVRAAAAAQRPASHANAIPWLLLRVTTQEGQGALTGVTEIRRIDTFNGTAPAGGCDAAHFGREVRMRYSAVYEFYAPQ